MLSACYGKVSYNLLMLTECIFLLHKKSFKDSMDDLITHIYSERIKLKYDRIQNVNGSHNQNNVNVSSQKTIKWID